MSRILKRPMFRIGGSTNEGIMHGLVDRRGYDNGAFGERVKKRKSALDEIYSSIPMPESRFPLGQIGLNLVSGEFAGDGFLSNVGKSVKGPYSEWIKEQDALDRMKYQLDVTKTGQAVADVTAMDMAKAKAAGETGYLKDETVERQYKDLLTNYSDRPEAKMNWTEENIFPHSFATLYSDIKLNASKSPQGQDLWRRFVGVLPNKRQSGRVTEWKYDEMNSGAIYFHPTEMAFFEKIPSVKDAGGNIIEPAHVLKINPYTFEVIEKNSNIPGLE